MKRTILILSVLFSFPFIARADLESWKKAYEERVPGIVEHKLKMKPNFPTDLQFTKPDFVVYVPKVEPEKLGDTYDDHFQVFDKPNGKLFAVWCQASYEGAIDQHVAFSRSTDKGKTWEPPRILAGNRTLAEGIASNGAIASWGFPMVSKTGRIYITYNQHVPGKSEGIPHSAWMTGIFSDDDGDTWSKPQTISIPRTSFDPVDATIPPGWIVWQKPLRLGKEGKYLVGVSRHAKPELRETYNSATEFIRFENIDENPEPKDFITKWFMQGEKSLRNGKYCEEPSIVKLPDGRLFCVMRTGTGTPVWSISDDLGETWSAVKPLLMKDGGDPIPHSMSPCPIYDAKGNEAASGLYMLFAHNKYNAWSKSPWQNRGPLYLFAGRFQKDADQPVWFDGPKRFAERSGGNSFYTSLTVFDGKTVLWYPDQKFYLLGKIIGDNYFDGKADVEVFKPGELDLSAYSIRQHADGKPLRIDKSPKLELKNGAKSVVFDEGAKVFSDRSFVVVQCPKMLEGKRFVQSSILGVEVACRGDGMLYVLTPMKDRNRDDQSPTLLENGFEKVSQPETLLYEKFPDGIVTLYQKEIKAGETIKLGQWAVLVY